MSTATTQPNVGAVDLGKARSDPDGQSLAKRPAEHLIRDLPYPSHYKAVLYALQSYINDRRGSRAWPSTRTLAHASGASIDTVWKALKQAEEDGVIYRLERAGRSTHYVFFNPADPPHGSLEAITTDPPHGSPNAKRSAPRITGDPPHGSKDTVKDTTLLRTQVLEEEEEEKSSISDTKNSKRERPAITTATVTSQGAPAAPLRDGGLADGKIRDADYRPAVESFPCGCRASTLAACACIKCDQCRVKELSPDALARFKAQHGDNSGSLEQITNYEIERAQFEKHNATWTHKTPPAPRDTWPRKQICLEALGFTKPERQALSRQYGDSLLLRRYRWTLKNGRKVKNPKKWFSGSLEMADIIDVELTPFDMKSGYGFPEDGMIPIDRTWSRDA